MAGPPAAGKTQFASRFVLEHPEFKFCSIDAYRVEHKNEDKAWQHFQEDIIKNKDVIVESCGLGWRLEKVFEACSGRKIFTVAFIGDFNEIYERLSQRQHKRPIDYDYDLSDEFAAISYVLENIDQVCYDMIIDTSTVAVEEQYQFLSRNIALERVKELTGENE